MNDSSFRMRIVIRLILLFLLILLVLLSSVGILVNYRQTEYASRIRNFVEMRFRFVGDQIEREIWQILQRQFNVINDDEIIIDVIQQETYSNYQRICSTNHIMDELKSIQESSGFAEKCYLIIPAKNMAYGSNGRLETISESGIDISGLSSKYSTSFQLIDQKLAVVSAYPQSLRDDAEFVVVTFIDEKNLQMLLDDNCDQYNTFLLLEETQCNWYLAGSDASYRLDDASLQRDHTYGNDRILQKGILNNNFSLSAHLNISEIEGKWFQLVFWGGMLILLVVSTLFFGRQLYRLLSLPINTLTDAFEHIKRGDFSVSIHYHRGDEFQKIYSGYNNMKDQLKELIRDNYEKELMVSKAEMKLLQAQISPHFLYNSFYNIYSLAQLQDCEGIQNLTSRLAEYYRYITRNKADQVELWKEYEFTKNYIEIQNIRFGDRIDCRMEALPSDLSSFMVPKLFMQPMVENAYRHGLKDVESNGILLITHHRVADGNLTIIIENNGKEVTDEELAEINHRLKIETFHGDEELTGMVNTHRRLRILLGENSGISLGRSDLGGMKVEIHLEFSGEGKPNV